VVRAAAVAIAAAAPADAPVYVVLGPRPAHYADRRAACSTATATRYRTIADPAAIDPRVPGVDATSSATRRDRPAARGARGVRATSGGGLQWIEVYAVGLP
jgi:hypothetical protein